VTTELQHKYDAPTTKSDVDRLPTGVKVYFRSGIPQLFNLIAIDSDKAWWLYVPQSELDRIELADTTAPSADSVYQLGQTGLELDDIPLYPLIRDNAIVAFVQVEEGVDVDKVMDCLPVDRLAGARCENGSRLSELTGIFVSTLFQKDNDLATVLRKALDLIAGQCEGSYVGLYRISPEREWILRMAVGDIHLSDCLPNRPSGARMKEWS
jgi:hypothetical protein